MLECWPSALATTADRPPECLYPEPSRQRRKRVRTVDQFEALETRLKQMEACLEKATRAPEPGLCSSTPKRRPRSRGSSGGSHEGPKRVEGAHFHPTDKFVLTQHATENSEDGYHGYSGDRSFIQRMREVRNWAGAEVHRRLRRSDGQLPSLFEPDYGLAATAYLPSKERSRTLIDAALDAYALTPILHRPTFDYSWNVIYSIEPSQYTADELRFLPLLYAVLALGCLFAQADAQKSSRDTAKADGYVCPYSGVTFPVLTSASLRFFAASRCLIDLSHCANETNLQTIVFLNLFLIETARTGSCYSYLSHTLTLALRMGLHRSMLRDCDPIRSEVGKRVFWTIRLFANYFATIVGMPRPLGDDNVDQDLPVEANDGYITDAKVSPQPSTEVCQILGMNTYIKLHNILGQVVRHVYPLRGISKSPGKESASYMVSIENIGAIEEALKAWEASVPPGFRLGDDDPESRSLLRAQYLLSMSHAHVQVYLYRPFLHYLSKFSRPGGSVYSSMDYTSYASACLQACQKILRLSGQVCQRELIQGCNVVFSHMVFTSIISLLYVLLSSVGWGEGGVDIIVGDIALGCKVMWVMSHYNEAIETGQSIVAVGHSFASMHQMLSTDTLLKAMIALLPKELAHARDRLQNSSCERGNLQHAQDNLTADLNGRDPAAPLAFQPTMLGAAEKGLPVHVRPELTQISPQLYGADASATRATATAPFSRHPVPDLYPDANTPSLDCLEAQPFSFADAPFFGEMWNGMNMACFSYWDPASSSSHRDGSGNVDMNSMDPFSGGFSKGVGVGVDMGTNINMGLDQVRQMINNNAEYTF
ncbi:hypothetical protein G647_02066 [Cladophialophora carrionii CBS 160.54]|uniref:Xylanolytic transcriptional activator regulatory domain-containing protein n=1 Tax=Cladophialophora carrionii CBS 160.54 TaxID=1279043 RepID=V9DTF1_9EURO|nr:uncharacterized protein G647_02066 [Cladophialophora carrionii CBS 160.54]ETI29613.1 hypothetical protein G647_02066 [Cladophialophora carrionii CBS 160.54]